VKLFPKQSIYPFHGCGDFPNSKDFIVSTYQLVASKCPHLEERKCLIYPERPLTCKSFPLEAVGPNIFTLNSDCKWFQKLKKERKMGLKFPLEYGAIDAVEEQIATQLVWSKVGEIFMDCRIHRKMMWVFNVESKKWEIESY